jgi:YVTN family beta-propeller protein
MKHTRAPEDKAERKTHRTWPSTTGLFPFLSVPHSVSPCLRGSIGLLAIVLASAGLAEGEGPAIPQARPAVEGNRAPYDLVFSRDGKRVYVTENAEGSVAVVDTSTMEVAARYSSGGEQPTGLGLTPDGSELVVSNTYSGSISLLDAALGKQRSQIRLPGMPHGIAVAPDGKRAYVAVSQLDEVAVLDLAAAAVVHRVPVGRRPRALDLTPDGKMLAVANMAGGSVSVIDTETLKEEGRVPLKGTNIRGIAVTATGSEAYATVMPAFNGRATDDPKEIWHNLVQAVTLEGAESTPAEDQWMDFARMPGTAEVFGTPDQHDIVVDRGMKHAWVSASGRDVVTRITIHDRRRDAIWPISQVETVTGANPRGLALSPDGKQVWTANHLGNSLSVIDAATASVVKTIDLGRASRIDPTIAGQYLFNNARFTRLHRFTCNSCHPDGGSDGLSWRFVHVNDGFSRRNSRDLRIGLAETAPFRWSGFEKHLDAFIESEVTGLLRGPKPSVAQLQALAAAVNAFRLPPNPYRAAGGDLTPSAQQGQVLFAGKAGCASCHSGPRKGGTGTQAWVGTTPEGRTVDVPHLAGVYDSAPYLHDGRAATLEAVFTQHNTSNRHGSAHLLTPEERGLLLRYLREL